MKEAAIHDLVQVSEEFRDGKRYFIDIYELGRKDMLYKQDILQEFGKKIQGLERGLIKGVDFARLGLKRPSTTQMDKLEPLEKKRLAEHGRGSSRGEIPAVKSWLSTISRSVGLH